MTAQIPAETLADRLDRAHRMSCSDPNDPERKTLYSEARDALAAETARAEAAEVKVERVWRLIRRYNVEKNGPVYEYVKRDLRAALADEEDQ